MEWISVNDTRKPPHRVDLLLVIDDEGDRYIERGDYWSDSGDFIAAADPCIGRKTTHWMLMPELPEDADATSQN